MTPQNPTIDVWCKEFALGSDGSTGDERRKQFTSFCENVTDSDIEPLTRLAFGLKAPQTIERKLQEAFFAEADRHVSGAAARELQVLAAATLAATTQGGTKRSALAATGVLCASFAGLRTPNLPVDLISIARSAYEGMSVDVRARRDVRRVIPSIKVDISAFTQTMAQSFNPQSVTEALKKVSEAIATSTTAAIRAATADPAQRHVAAMEEELQILWWLVGAWSDDLGCEFAKIPEKSRALVLGAELAALTRTYPGPRSIPGLLSKAGVTRISNRIDEAVGSVELAWIKRTLNGRDPSPALTPLHFALQRRDETAGDDSWRTGWTGATGLDAASSVEDIALGLQFYQEKTLLAQL